MDASRPADGGESLPHCSLFGLLTKRRARPVAVDGCGCTNKWVPEHLQSPSASPPAPLGCLAATLSLPPSPSLRSPPAALDCSSAGAAEGFIAHSQPRHRELG